jgi:hypothetical protein
MEQSTNVTTWRTLRNGYVVWVSFKIRETVINVPIVEPIAAPDAGIKTFNQFLCKLYSNIPQNIPNHRDRPKNMSKPALRPDPGQTGEGPKVEKIVLAATQDEIK